MERKKARQRKSKREKRRKRFEISGILAGV